MIFFDEFAASEGFPDYYKLLYNNNFLASFDMTVDNQEIAVTNFPQIRLPRTEWFSIEGINRLAENKNQDYHVISKTQGLTREKALKIKDTAKAIFLYATSVPFTLIIPKTKAQIRLVCMEPFDKYFFKDIDAPELDFIDLCKIFAPLSNTRDYTFYIDTLRYKRGIFKGCVFKILRNMEAVVDFELTHRGSDQIISARTMSAELNDTTIKVELLEDRSAYEKETFEVPKYLQDDRLVAVKQMLERSKKRK